MKALAGRPKVVYILEFFNEIDKSWHYSSWHHTRRAARVTANRLRYMGPSRIREEQNDHDS